MSERLIDILMATYNGERFVGEQIESVQAQTYQNWRLLVSDDCSSDGTLDVVRRYAADDRRIQIVSEDVHYGGAKENFIALMGKSDAPYCMFCDQDDVWSPEKIEKTFDVMLNMEGESEQEKPFLVFTDMRVVNEELGVIAESFETFSALDPSRTSFPQVVAQSFAAGCTMMINSVSRDLSLQVRDQSNVIMHDWWLSLVVAAFGRIGYLNERTSLYRQHGMNEVGAVAYSPLKRMIHTTAMRKSVADTVKQACEFMGCYGGSLSDAQLSILAEFIASGKTRGIPALVHLVKSGCWKRGLRKLGQVSVAMTSTFD